VCDVVVVVLGEGALDCWIAECALNAAMKLEKNGRGVWVGILLVCEV